MSNCRAYLVLTIALTLGPVHVARAQQPSSDFAGVPDLIKAGDTVYVTDTAGHIRPWTLGDVPLEVLMQQAGLSRSNITHIARERVDSAWNGALIGLAVAATPWLIVCAADDWCYYNEYGSENLLRNSALITAAMGAGVGALIDLSIRKQVIIYQSSDKRSLNIGSSPTVVGSRTIMRISASF